MKFIVWWQDRLDKFRRSLRARSCGPAVHRRSLLLEPLETRLCPAAHDTLATAIFLPFDNVGHAQVSATLANPNEVDLYQVQLHRGDTLTAQVTAYSASNRLDSGLRLFDSSGLQLAFNDDENGRDPGLSFNATADGRYYVGISSFADFRYDPLISGSSSGGNSSGNYTLNLTRVLSNRGAPPAVMASGDVPPAVTNPVDGLTFIQLSGITIVNDAGGDLIATRGSFTVTINSDIHLGSFDIHSGSFDIQPMSTGAMFLVPIFVTNPGVAEPLTEGSGFGFAVGGIGQQVPANSQTVVLAGGMDHGKDLGGQEGGGRGGGALVFGAGFRDVGPSPSGPNSPMPGVGSGDAGGQHGPRTSTDQAPSRALMIASQPEADEAIRGQTRNNFIIGVDEAIRAQICEQQGTQGDDEPMLPDLDSTEPNGALDSPPGSGLNLEAPGVQAGQVLDQHWRHLANGLIRWTKEEAAPLAAVLFVTGVGQASVGDSSNSDDAARKKARLGSVVP